MKRATIFTEFFVTLKAHLHFLLNSANDVPESADGGY